MGNGTISFGAGFFFVVIGWPILGMILEAYGFIVLFSGFWPTLSVFLQKIPIPGRVVQQSYIRSEVPREPFVPLTEEEEDEVERAFAAPQNNVLVTHKNLCIDIKGKNLLCLRPGAWLNDEVINVYLELLKEREIREPQKFLKCHFFNTFFYKKLKSGGFKAVKRWTSTKKLGYSLIECDKIFVPIHKETHWCLAIIDTKDQKFQYLDSLKGKDHVVLKSLAAYFSEEVKDKSGKVIDVNSWEKDFVEELPEQENGFDCGMFMLKYVDFHSRGVGFSFNQEHMPYFRVRTAKEILRLRAN